MSYFALKHLHMSFAAMSGALFFLRGIFMLRESPLLHKASINRSSYVIDTVLLASALALVGWSGQYPFVVSWITVKIFAVIAYIAAGAIALRRAKTKAVRSGAFVVALLIFGYIVKLALTKQVA